MRIATLAVALALPLGAGCGQAATTSSIRQQFRDVTRQQRASFSEAGDAVMLAPTPDTGFAGQGEATHDCSSCIPR